MKKRQNVVAKEAKRAARLNERRKESMRLLPLLIPDNSYRAWPGSVRDVVLTARFPKPEVQVDPSAEKYAESEALRNKFIKLLHEPSIECEGPFAVTISVDDVIRVLLPMGKQFLTCPVPPWCRKTIDEYVPDALTTIKDALTSASKTLMAVGLFLTGTISRLDRKLFYFTFGPRSAFSGYDPLVIRIGAEVPEEISVVMNGKSRPALRLGWQMGWEGIDWLDMDAQIFGGPEGKRYPVYIQKHALYRFTERLAELGETTTFHLVASLEKPNLIEVKADGSYLFEYRFTDKRLGYIIAKVVKEKVIITTFLFLTMNGTPEAQKLYRRLRLTRTDIEYHQLDTLTAFIKTDLFDDPVMAQILKECGCGGLAETKEKLRTESDFAPKEFAAELKRYLQIDENEEKKILDRIKKETKEEPLATTKENLKILEMVKKAVANANKNDPLSKKD